MSGLPETQRQENFSLAYIRAIAARCGFSVVAPEDDYDSVDLLISARGAVEWDGRTSSRRSPNMAIQAKCTHAQQPNEGVLKYPLKLKNYEDLRDPKRITPTILVVLCVPKTWPRRLKWSDKSLILRQVAFWTSLRGRGPTKNSESVTVTMNEHFSPDALTRLMYQAAEGDL